MFKMNEKIKQYIIFLNTINNILEKYFEEQKEYIKCMPGCAYCCNEGHYPTSEIEFNYLKPGFKELDKEVRKSIKIKAVKLYKKRLIHLNKGNDIFKFTYECPFLHENKCLVYDYRPIVCRTHGLITTTFTEESGDTPEVHMPACTVDGLNYADVYDEKSKNLSDEKIKKLNKKNPPKIYSAGYSRLLDELKDVGYGDIRMLFEWVLLDIPNHQDIIAKIKKEV